MRLDYIMRPLIRGHASERMLRLRGYYAQRHTRESTGQTKLVTASQKRKLGMFKIASCGKGFFELYYYFMSCVWCLNMCYGKAPL